MLLLRHTLYQNIFNLISLIVWFCSVARFLLRVHCLKVEQAHWNDNLYHNCDLCDTEEDVQDEQRVIFKCTHPYMCNLRREYASLFSWHVQILLLWWLHSCLHLTMSTHMIWIFLLLLLCAHPQIVSLAWNKHLYLPILVLRIRVPSCSKTKINLIFPSWTCSMYEQAST